MLLVFFSSSGDLMQTAEPAARFGCVWHEPSGIKKGLRQANHGFKKALILFKDLDIAFVTTRLHSHNLPG
jgi:hypothetical protein